MVLNLFKVPEVLLVTLVKQICNPKIDNRVYSAVSPYGESAAFSRSAFQWALQDRMQSCCLLCEEGHG